MGNLYYIRLGIILLFFKMKIQQIMNGIPASQEKEQTLEDTRKMPQNRKEIYERRQKEAATIIQQYYKAYESRQKYEKKAKYVKKACQKVWRAHQKYQNRAAFMTWLQQKVEEREMERSRKEEEERKRVRKTREVKKYDSEGSYYTDESYYEIEEEEGVQLPKKRKKEGAQNQRSEE